MLGRGTQLVHRPIDSCVVGPDAISGNYHRRPRFAPAVWKLEWGKIVGEYDRIGTFPTPSYVICADEKTSIQARRRKQPTLPTAPIRPTYVEHEYFCMGSWTYLAAWDVHRARVFGRCEVKSGIAQPRSRHFRRPTERARLLPETVGVPLDAGRNKVVSHLRQKMTQWMGCC